MGWLSKNLPSLFIEAPNGSVHFKLKGKCIYKEKIYVNNNIYITKMYVFKDKVSYILEDEVYKTILVENKDKIETVLQDYASKEKVLRNINNEQSDSIKKIEEKLNKVKENENLLNTSLNEKIEEIKNLEKIAIELRLEISNLKGMLESNQVSKRELEEWFMAETSNKENTIKSLREVINNFRSDIEIENSKIIKENNCNIEKLRKEFEMLDKDFVDVAKSMGIFSKGEDRPQRGFRVKLD